MTLLGLPGNPLPETFDQKMARIVKNLPVTSNGPRLNKGQRGLILPSATEVMESSDMGSGQTIRQTTSLLRPDPLDLRQALLFWDVIHIPEELHPFYRDEPDFRFLDQAGVLRHYDGPSQDQIAALVPGGMRTVHTHGAKPIYERLRLNLFDHLEKVEPGQWAMGRGIRSPEIPEGEQSIGRGVRVTLTNMLPIPDADVNINDVMEFKLKRSDELIALTTYISKIYHVVSSGDTDEMVKGDYLREFEDSVNNYQKTLQESKMKAIMSNLLAGLNVAGPVATAITALTDPTGVLPISLLVIGGALKLEPFNGLTRRKGNEAFEYIGQYHRELSWTKGDR